MGGALLDEEVKDDGHGGEGLKINGSVMMALAESKEEVLAALKEDVYSTAGVWDWEKVTIRSAKPMNCGELASPIAPRINPALSPAISPRAANGPIVRLRSRML